MARSLALLMLLVLLSRVLSRLLQVCRGKCSIMISSGEKGVCSFSPKLTQTGGAFLHSSIRIPSSRSFSCEKYTLADRWGNRSLHCVSGGELRGRRWTRVSCCMDSGGRCAASARRGPASPHRPNLAFCASSSLLVAGCKFVADPGYHVS